jgi:hypothetical protein
MATTNVSLVIGHLVIGHFRPAGLSRRDKFEVPHVRSPNEKTPERPALGFRVIVVSVCATTPLPALFGGGKEERKQSQVGHSYLIGIKTVVVEWGSVK